MITPTWNTLLLGMLVGLTIFGFVARKAKTATLLIALYIALTIANEIGLELYRFIKKAEFGNLDTSLFMVKLVMFAFLGFLLFIEGEHIASGEGSGSGMAQTIWGTFYGFLAGGIVVTTMIYFMSATDASNLLAKSVVARTLEPFRVWFLIPFPFLLAISSLIKRFK